MESQTQRQGETSEQFAERVRDLISSRAGLKTIPWDGAPPCAAVVAARLPRLQPAARP